MCPKAIPGGNKSMPNMPASSGPMIAKDAKHVFDAYAPDFEAHALNGEIVLHAIRRLLHRRL